MSDKVAKAFEDFLRTRRDHRDGLTARQQLWTAFEAGAQFTLDEIRERTGLAGPTQETPAAPLVLHHTFEPHKGLQMCTPDCPACAFQRTGSTANR